MSPLVLEDGEEQRMDVGGACTLSKYVVIFVLSS